MPGITFASALIVSQARIVKLEFWECVLCYDVSEFLVNFASGGNIYIHVEREKERERIHVFSQ